ncbi:hypothetical protein SVIOM342S_07654 [Streptomyces violaceorubidus]
MADDALRAATPVLRVVHAAAIKVLEENGVDTAKFGARAGRLSAAVQDAVPSKEEVCDAYVAGGRAGVWGGWTSLGAAAPGPSFGLDGLAQAPDGLAHRPRAAG